MLRQQQFLTKMLERLDSEKESSMVLNDIEDVRNSLTANKNMVLYMAVNVDKLANQVPDIYEPWKDFYKSDDLTLSKYVC